MYQLSGEEHVVAWLESESSPEAWEAMLKWLPRLAEDPEEVALAVKTRPGVPAYIAAVPGSDAFVAYTVIEQYKVVMIFSVETVRYEDLPPG